jgi:hypothetical protein
VCFPETGERLASGGKPTALEIFDKKGQKRAKKRAKKSEQKKRENTVWQSQRLSKVKLEP